MQLGRRSVRGVVISGAILSASCGINRQGYVRAQTTGDLTHVGVAPGPFDARQVDACGPGGPAPDSAFDRWPYLQRVETDRLELLWTTRASTDFRVVITDPDGRALASARAMVDTAASPPSSARQYVARLDGLPAGSTLCYQVVTGSGTHWTRPTGVMTAPVGRDATVRFVALGDLGKRSPDQYAVARQIRSVSFDFMLVTGDVAYDSGKRRELEAYFFDVYPDILRTIPVFPASGNHDYRTEDARPFREAFSLFDNGGPHGTERWYSFDWGPVHVAVLDTEIRETVQAEWLDDDLAGHDRPWTVVAAHRPPYSSGRHGSDDDMRELFVPIFERHDVALVLGGHDHHYERTRETGGVVYVVTGGGGRGTRKTGTSDFTALSARVAHFVWLEATATSLRMVAVDATGQQFDSVRLTTSPPAREPSAAQSPAVRSDSRPLARTKTQSAFVRTWKWASPSEARSFSPRPPGPGSSPVAWSRTAAPRPSPASDDEHDRPHP